MHNTSKTPQASKQGPPKNTVNLAAENFEPTTRTPHQPNTKNQEIIAPANHQQKTAMHHANYLYTKASTKLPKNHTCTKPTPNLVNSQYKSRNNYWALCKL